MRRAATALLFIAVLTAGCIPPRNGQGTQVMSTQAAADGGFVSNTALGYGDMLEVKVYQEPDLGGVYRVSTEGNVDFPLCGRVRLFGLTPTQAADAITACLQDRFLKHPQVSVVVREYNSKKVFIFGEIAKPGTFSFSDNMTIIELVTQAGSFTKSASRNNVSVIRQVNGLEQKIRVPVEDIGVGRERNFPLQPGDIVFVPESLL
jgi:polysaccharide export outer membrane protein